MKLLLASFFLGLACCIFYLYFIFEVGLFMPAGCEESPFSCAEAK